MEEIKSELETANPGNAASPTIVKLSRSEAIKKGVAAAKAAGTYKGGKPKTCSLCGWSHKVGNACREPKNEARMAKVGSSPAGSP